MLKLEGDVLSRDEVITKKSDVEDQLAAARRQLSQMDQQKIQCQKELETASGYILELEERYCKSQEAALELLRTVKD